MSEIVPRVEVYAFEMRDWRFRLVDESGVTESGPLRGVRGHAGAVLHEAHLAHRGVPIVVLDEDA